MKTYRHLIIGGGMAADAAVEGIREVDENGSIGILAEEPDPPYKRPPLSKDLWTKDADPDEIDCGTEAKGAEILNSTRVARIDPANHKVTCQSGRVCQFDKLLLATGGTPKRLPFGGDLVIYYRTLEHYRKLRAMSDAGGHFVVIGGGFIGAELAAALAIEGNEVTMVFPETSVMGRLLPAAFARELTRCYRERGIGIVSGCKPAGIEAEDERRLVHVDDGKTLVTDGIVAGLGIEPNSQLAEDAGLDVSDGIMVDKQLRTSHPDIFAAGDVANFHNPMLDRRFRVEHEDNALTMGRMAGRNMAGDGCQYDHLPFFYSDLFDFGYEAVGETDPELEIVTELHDPEDKGPIFYLKNNRVRGVVFWNWFGQVDAGRELIAKSGPHTHDLLKAWTSDRMEE